MTDHLWGFVEAKYEQLLAQDLEKLCDFGELHEKIHDLAEYAYEMGRQSPTADRPHVRPCAHCDCPHYAEHFRLTEDDGPPDGPDGVCDCGHLETSHGQNEAV